MFTSGDPGSRFFGRRPGQLMEARAEASCQSISSMGMGIGGVWLLNHKGPRTVRRQLPSYDPTYGRRTVRHRTELLPNVQPT